MDLHAVCNEQGSVKTQARNRYKAASIRRMLLDRGNQERIRIMKDTAVPQPALLRMRSRLSSP